MNRAQPRAGLGFALGEGWRNAGASRLLGLLIAVLSAAVFGGIAVADALTVADLVTDERAWVAAGGQVLAVTNETGVPGYACEHLNGAPGVRAAVGLVHLNQRAALANAPEANLAVTGFTSGLAGFLTSPLPLDGVVMNTTAAADFGLASGQRLGLSLADPSDSNPEPDPTKPIVADAAGRRATPGTRVLTVTDLTILGDAYAAGVALPIAASGTVDTCMVWAEFGAKDTLMASLPGLLPGAGDKPTVVADRLVTGQFTRDYHAEYLARSWRWVPLAGGVALGLIWILIRWVRRSEDGLYQSLGAARPHRALVRLTEWTLYSVVGAAIAALAADLALALLRPAAGMQTHLIRSIALGLAASVATAALAGLLPARNPLDALKDR